jgi:hypothetical protein
VLGRLILGLVVGVAAQGILSGSDAGAASGVRFHYGTCDASAAVALGDNAFVVANDEDSRLRMYVAGVSGPAVWELDWSPFLELTPAHRETDIEGAARVGDTVYWITSHARNQDGKLRENRHRFFATRVEGSGRDCRLTPVGRPYRALVDDLTAQPGFDDLDLGQARQKAPKDEGALNIEGLAAAGDGSLWIGFRNPVPGGKAILVRLMNPAEMIEGRRASFGEIVRLELGKRGIRDLVWTGEEYIIVAGSSDGRGRSRVYLWPGPGAEPLRLRDIDLEDFNAEAVIHFGGTGAGEIWLISDDSSRESDGVPCRDLETAGLRSFRSLRIR